MDDSQLEENAKSVRKRIFEFKTRTKFGHLASCLCCVDVLVSLYRDPQTRFNPEEDIFLFSKGHGSPSVYPILADLGTIDEGELDKYCEPEGILRLHADQSIPGCHFVGGSLGNGIGYAAGYALASGKSVYTLVGDAELYEGSVWETLIFVAHHNINNLRIIIDRNSMGILGKTEELLKLEPLEDKFRSFGLDVVTVDGHSFDELRTVFSENPSRPQVIIANTIKGKGVSYMEDKWRYHTIIPKEEDLLEIGIKELS
jgi:transketolase